MSFHSSPSSATLEVAGWLCSSHLKSEKSHFGVEFLTVQSHGCIFNGLSDAISRAVKNRCVEMSNIGLSRNKIYAPE